MNKVSISNEYTGKSITVDTSRPLTRKKIATWRSKLHNPGCTSGDDLGGRGKQEDPDAYEALLTRAQQVVLTGRDEQ